MAWNIWIYCTILQILQKDIIIEVLWNININGTALLIMIYLSSLPRLPLLHHSLLSGLNHTSASIIRWFTHNSYPILTFHIIFSKFYQIKFLWTFCKNRNIIPSVKWQGNVYTLLWNLSWTILTYHVSHFTLDGFFCIIPEEVIQPAQAAMELDTDIPDVRGTALTCNRWLASCITWVKVMLCIYHCIYVGQNALIICKVKFIINK